MRGTQFALTIVMLGAACGCGPGQTAGLFAGEDTAREAVGPGRIWHVAITAETGDGSPNRPFGGIQQALAVAQPNDTVTVAAGAYTGPLRSVRSGAPTPRSQSRGRRGQ